MSSVEAIFTNDGTVGVNPEVYDFGVHNPFTGDVHWFRAVVKPGANVKAIAAQLAAQIHADYPDQKIEIDVRKVRKAVAR
jgi:hypothetical protein